MRSTHKEWHNHANARKNDVKAQRKGHLEPGSEKIIHKSKSNGYGQSIDEMPRYNCLINVILDRSTLKLSGLRFF